MTVRLIGGELIDRLKELDRENPNYTREERASLCGYTRTTRSGKVRVALQDFYEACLEAEKVLFQPKKPDGRGRKPLTDLKVSPRTTLIVPSRYLQAIGAEAGAVIAVKVGRKTITLTVKSLGEEGEPDEDDLDVDTEEEESEQEEAVAV